MQVMNVCKCYMAGVQQNTDIIAATLEIETSSPVRELMHAVPKANIHHEPCLRTQVAVVPGRAVPISYMHDDVRVAIEGTLRE